MNSRSPPNRSIKYRRKSKIMPGYSVAKPSSENMPVIDFDIDCKNISAVIGKQYFLRRHARTIWFYLPVTMWSTFFKLYHSSHSNSFNVKWASGNIFDSSASRSVAGFSTVSGTLTADISNDSRFLAQLRLYLVCDVRSRIFRSDNLAGAAIVPPCCP